MSASMSMSMAMASAILTGSTLLLSTPRFKPTLLSTKSPLLLLLLHSRSVHHHLQSLFGLAAAPRALCQAILTVLVMLGPFCPRVLLTLEEKHPPYDMKLVDLSNKQDWFLKISTEGKVPVAKLDEKWVPDSDVITQSVEENPDPPLATPPEKATTDSKSFSMIIGFLKSIDPNDGTEQALLNELKSFDDYIKENLVFSMDSFVQSKALPEDVIAGWRPKDFP